MITQQNKQHVLTFWIDRGWHDPDTSYNGNSVNRGYKSLNNAITKLAEYVTIQSVSYSNIIFPFVGSLTQVRLFATVVYTGPAPIDLYPGELDSTDPNPTMLGLS